MVAGKRIYHCSTCKNVTDRSLLMAKKVVFLTMGEGGKTLKSRVVSWQCPTCVVKDPHWNLDAFKAPGSKYLRAEIQGSQDEVTITDASEAVDVS